MAPYDTLGTSVISVVSLLIIGPANMTPIFTTLLADAAIGAWVLFTLPWFGIGNVNFTSKALDSLPAHRPTPCFLPGAMNILLAGGPLANHHD